MRVTGILIDDVTALATAEDATDRGEFYVRLNNFWPAEYRAKLFELYDQLVPAPNSPEAKLAQPAPWL